jgi:hypothetical protein
LITYGPFALLFVKVLDQIDPTPRQRFSPCPRSTLAVSSFLADIAEPAHRTLIAPAQSPDISGWESRHPDDSCGVH